MNGGERIRDIDRQRRLADATFHVHERDHLHGLGPPVGWWLGATVSDRLYGIFPCFASTSSRAAGVSRSGLRVKRMTARISDPAAFERDESPRRPLSGARARGRSRLAGRNLTPDPSHSRRAVLEIFAQIFGRSRWRVCEELDRARFRTSRIVGFSVRSSDELVARRAKIA